MANQKMLEKPLHWKKPRKIFVCSMGDFFYGETLAHIKNRLDVEEIIDNAARHTYLILTKRPHVARTEHKARPQVWLGTSCENQEWYDKRVPQLLACEAKTRFLSIEPMLGPIDLHSLEGISWVIFGGESGIGARPFDLNWLRAGIAQCDAAGVPVFVKQLGRQPVQGGVWCKEIHDPRGGDMSEWPEDLRRREFPNPRNQKRRKNNGQEENSEANPGNESQGTSCKTSRGCQRQSDLREEDDGSEEDAKGVEEGQD
jgi:hypothetical protein